MFLIAAAFGAPMAYVTGVLRHGHGAAGILITSLLLAAFGLCLGIPQWRRSTCLRFRPLVYGLAALAYTTVVIAWARG